MNLKDDYGNNINFSDKILGDITIKGLLGKWTYSIYDKALHALTKYSMKTHNIDAGDLKFVKQTFTDCENMITYLTPVLEDLTNQDLYGIENIFIKIFGHNSDEYYVIQLFLMLSGQSSWDPKDMWNDCADRSRLHKIITS